MVSKIDEARTKHQAQVDKEVLAAIEFELEGSIAHAGGVLTGFSVKYGVSDCLIVLRAVVGSRPMISFVGAPDLSSALRKCVSSAYHDDLRWKEDGFAKNEV